MSNPWEDISLDDYENHMSLGSVRQLQAMNSIMKEQLLAYHVESAMILGIAGGNGLEHVNTDKYRKIYGVDINADYLSAVAQRYAELSGVLECLHIDLINEAGYSLILQEFCPLPNGKALVRLDYRKTEVIQ